jgi:hypothetical protein
MWCSKPILRDSFTDEAVAIESPLIEARDQAPPKEDKTETTPKKKQCM